MSIKLKILLITGLNADIRDTLTMGSPVTLTVKSVKIETKQQQIKVVLLNSFDLNCNNLGRHEQTQKLKPLYAA